MAAHVLRRRFSATIMAIVLALTAFPSARDITDQPGLLDDFEPPYAESVTKAPPHQDSIQTKLVPPKVRKAPRKRTKQSRGVAPGIVSIPGGCYQMGNTDSVAGENARPRHEVCISAFRMDRLPVTQREYALRTGVAPWELCEGYACTPPNPDHPAWFVTWFEADSFCRTSGGRLPTEAEYEYAMRGGDSTTYPWGDSLGYACDNANLADLTLLKISKNWRAFPCSDGSALVDIAGLRKPNRWGLYDISGNVWAWVSDWYSSQWYAISPKQDPKGPANGSGRVMRGGSWITGPDGARSSYRDGLAPNLRYFGAIGFRCVYPDAPATPSPAP